MLYDDSDGCERVAHLRAELKVAGYTVRDRLIGCGGLTVELTPNPPSTTSHDTHWCRNHLSKNTPIALINKNLLVSSNAQVAE